MNNININVFDSIEFFKSILHKNSLTYVDFLKYNMPNVSLNKLRKFIAKYGKSDLHNSNLLIDNNDGKMLDNLLIWANANNTNPIRNVILNTTQIALHLD
jgi:hypothetical protein